MKLEPSNNLLTGKKNPELNNSLHNQMKMKSFFVFNLR